MIYVTRSYRSRKYVRMYLVLILLLTAGRYQLCLAAENATIADSTLELGEACCGVAAVEWVANRLGVKLEGVSYERLRALPVATVADLRDAIEGNGLVATSFYVGPQSGKLLKWCNAFVKNGAGEAVLLIPEDSDESHFCLLESFDGKMLELRDPSTAARFEIPLSKLNRDGRTSIVQLVRRSDGSIWTRPIRPDQLTGWFLLPTIALAISGFEWARGKR